MDPLALEVGSAAVVLAVVAVIKQAAGAEHDLGRWLPIIGVLVGIALNEVAVAVYGGDYGKAAVNGFLTGLIASGFYSATKATIRG